MRIVVIDYETYFNRASGYTLDKLSTESYIRNPQFQAHGAAIKWHADIPARWYDERMLRHVLKEEDWSDTLLVAHHMQFDGLILSRHYGVTPRAWGCTLSMARLILGNHISVSLDSVRKQFGIPSKTTPYGLMDGKHWADMDERTRELVAEGCVDEVESIWQLFHKFMADGFSAEELKIVDLTVKMFVQPRLQGDVDLLATLWESESKRKRRHLEDLGVTASELQSSAKFAGLLRDCGVDPSMKPGKNGDIYAFAKSDQFMRDLLEYDDDRVRALAEARLGQKSTLLQTRAATLGHMATRGPLCVPLLYCGAHTTRWAGTGGVNFQNLKRGSDLRKAIMAPEGYLLAALDLKAIEWIICRYLAGETDYVEMFRRGEDPYCPVATKFFGYHVTPAMKRERQGGKILELQAQYGSGGPKLRMTLRNNGIEIDAAAAEKAKQDYRSLHAGTVAYWRTADGILAALAKGETTTWGPMEVKNRKIILPNGCPLNYDTLSWHQPEEKEERPYYRLLTRAGFVKMYGAKLVENVVQALARVVLSQAMLAIDRELNLPIASCTHDEVLLIIPDDSRAEDLTRKAADIMRRSPQWLPGIPLDAEYTIGKRYAK